MRRKQSIHSIRKSRMIYWIGELADSICNVWIPFFFSWKSQSQEWTFQTHPFIDRTSRPPPYRSSSIGNGLLDDWKCCCLPVVVVVPITILNLFGKSTFVCLASKQASTNLMTRGERQMDLKKLHRCFFPLEQNNKE